MSRLPSLEPSSTITSSRSLNVCASTLSIAAGRKRAWLYDGIPTLAAARGGRRGGRRPRGDLGGGDVELARSAHRDQGRRAPPPTSPRPQARARRVRAPRPEAAGGTRRAGGRGGPVR